MRRRVIIITLVLGIALVSVSLLRSLTRYHLPGNHEGYRPQQPIEYSHRVHAGELEIPCLYCHSAAERSRHAGVPSANVCMNCHEYVTASLGAVREEERQARNSARRVHTRSEDEIREEERGAKWRGELVGGRDAIHRPSLDNFLLCNRRKGMK